MAERQVRVAVVMDDSSYVAGGASMVSTNTKIATSSEDLAAITKKTADAQVAAILKVREASKLRIASFQNIAANAPSAEVATAATVAMQREQAKLARSYGVTTVASRGLSTATKTTERDLNKTVRGALAGTGVFSSLGRSLAFASSGFIAIAAGSSLIRASIKAAQDEAVAQKQVARQLETSGKSWQQYGAQIDVALLKESHLAGFTKADLLTSFGYLVRVGGNVQKSLKLTGLAADIARARSISLQSASIALAKALGGSATALKRLGIIVPKNVSTTAALAYVTQKFAGQARAGTTASERFHAVLTDTGATIGTALLPTFNRLATSLADWLSKMNESGRLTKDVNSALSIAGAAFHALGSAIKVVDDVTGSFKNTLELLLGIFAVKKVIVFGTALEGLAAKWGLVATAATEASAAQTAALAEGGAAGGAGLAGGAARRAGLAGLGIGAPELAFALAAGVGANKIREGGLANVNPLSSNAPLTNAIQGVVEKAYSAGVITAQQAIAAGLTSVAGQPVVTPGLRNLGRGGSLAPSFFPNFAAGGQNGGGGPGPFGTAKPIAVFKSFTDTIGNQLAQARAALTKTTADDVAAAKREIAFIKREISHGHLQGASLVQALQAQASAVSTIQAAEAAAVQKQTARIQAQIDPLRLEVSLSRAQALGQSTLPALRALRAAAQRVIVSGNATLAQQKQAYDQITSLNSQIQQAIQQGLKSFVEPMKLQIALAREQAFGQSTTATLEAMKRAALKALRSGKYTGQALIDLYNEIASINQQLQSATTAGLGKFKQLNLNKLTSDLGLTPAQRKALKARLSQVGPGGTVPGNGTGAYGYTIGRDDRPIHTHTHISIDGKKVADNTTRHQHRRRHRNSSQRRGPNAGSSG